MRFFLTWVGVLVCLLEVVVATQLKSFIERGYYCRGGITIKPEILEKALSDIKAAVNIKKKSREARIKLSNSYYGPPLGKTFNVWPVSPLISDSYDEAMQTPFRMIYDIRSLTIFAVVTHRGGDVTECKLIERALPRHSPFDFKCLGAELKFGDLLAAANAACSKLGVPAKTAFPVRYNGLSFEESGLQRYLYPVKADGTEWKSNEAPGPHRVVLNARCKVAGAVTFSGKTEYACTIHTAKN